MPQLCYRTQLIYLLEIFGDRDFVHIYKLQHIIQIKTFPNIYMYNARKDT